MTTQCPFAAATPILALGRVASQLRPRPSAHVHIIPPPQPRRPRHAVAPAHQRHHLVPAQAPYDVWRHRDPKGAPGHAEQHRHRAWQH
ncbi:hypothetical protein Pelo_19732 [Pelomyxa schiedti]|nr:hypothetical protein Pelo_19732 [Pelomyxa schiedti]